VLVLIDESGDPGFKVIRGSTTHFVVAMVIFDDFGEAERTSAAIAEAREALGARPEFKFSKCSDDLRDGFFQAVAAFRFKVRALVVNKEKIYSDNLRTNTERFYNYFVQQLLRHDDGALVDARVKIDKSGDRRFKNELAVYLRRQLPRGRLDSLKFSDSRKDNLIQLADMVAGAIRRSYMAEYRDDAARWRNMIARKIANVWEFR